MAITPPTLQHQFIAPRSPVPENKPELTWYGAVTAMEPHVVKLSTPRGHGTGFLLSICGDLCAIATAAHVVDQAHYWEEPIRVNHPSSSTSKLVRHTERAIFLDSSHDTAALMIDRDELAFPNSALPLVPRGKFLRVGNEIGWLGFPAVETTSLCFFGGRISAWNEAMRFYFVDGVAIHGVSGGPAFFLTHSQPTLVGVVSAYVPNRVTGEVLPGLSVVRDVIQFHELAPTFESLSQAKAQESPATPPVVPPVEVRDKTETRR